VEPRSQRSSIRSVLGELQPQAVTLRGQAMNNDKGKIQKQVTSKVSAPFSQLQTAFGQVSKDSPSTRRVMARSEECRQLDLHQDGTATPRPPLDREAPRTPFGFRAPIGGASPLGPTPQYQRLLPLSASSASTTSLDASVEESPGHVSTWSAGGGNSSPLAPDLQASSLDKQASPGSVPSPSTPFFGTDSKASAREFTDASVAPQESRLEKGCMEKRLNSEELFSLLGVNRWNGRAPHAPAQRRILRA